MFVWSASVLSLCGCVCRIYVCVSCQYVSCLFVGPTLCVCVCVCVCVCMHACVRVLVCFERTRETEFLSTELNALERKKVGLSEMESSKKSRFSSNRTLAGKISLAEMKASHQ